jgi:formiminotetrahydrofolate cyclodeaminase
VQALNLEPGTRNLQLQPMLTSLPLSRFLNALRSPDPTPGGGSAAALAGAAGASLLAMVSALPKPRAASPADLDRLKNAGERCTAAAERLESLIDRDAVAYDAVMAAYRLPKGSDDERRVRSERIQGAMRGAIDVPLEVMRTCGDALIEAASVAALGNANAASDVEVGIALLAAGLEGARANVEINLGTVKDEVYVAAVRTEAGRVQMAADTAVASAHRP